MTTPEDRDPTDPAETDTHHLDELRPEHDSKNPALEDEPTPDEPPAR